MPSAPDTVDHPAHLEALAPLRTDRRAPAARELPAHYVRPLAARELRGLVWVGRRLLTSDTRTGRLALVDPATDDTQVLGLELGEALRGARGLARSHGALWWTTADGVHRATWTEGEGGGEAGRDEAAPAEPAPAHPAGAHRAGADLPRCGAPELVLPVGGAEAITTHDDRLYLVVGGVLHELDLAAVERRAARGPSPVEQPADGADALRELSLRSVALPGVGRPCIAATAEALWCSDDVEQTVTCLDRGTLERRFAVVTPLEGPTAIAARREPGATHDSVHVAYYEDEPYLKDNPWIDPCWEVRYRDRALVHALHVHHDAEARMAWSTGHRVRMHYYVELAPDDDVLTDGRALTDVVWRMALPIESPRQRVVAIEPIGLPFELADEPDLDGRSQPVAVFRLPRVDRGTRLLLGWRATLEVFGIKHQLRPEDLDGAPDLDAARVAAYLVDDGDLDLGAPEVEAATSAAVGALTSPLLRARAIRAHVYDRLEYEMGNADSPVGVLARGTGSCGEYVGTIMALLRTDGLACRVAGRYKVPYQPWNAGPLHPDFNHVWVDLYLPGHGWVPVESNPDDVTPGGPYPDRFFMGLPWRHVEVGKDISFEHVTFDAGPDARRPRRRIGARRLSRNHIRFDVLAELAPTGTPTAELAPTGTPTAELAPPAAAPGRSVPR
ncbi:MAG TPA: transglutaminase family protein [Candidatus Nanopelagicales bacterium]